MGFACGRVCLATQQAGLIYFDRLDVGSRVLPILDPVFDQIEIVANAATVEADPMDAFHPVPLESIFLESGTTQIQLFASILFIDKLGHG